MNSEKKPDLKPISPVSLYNFMQDNRHLVIIDTRPLSKYLSGFIRKSYWLDTQLKDKLAAIRALYEYINKQDHNSLENEKKYKLSKLRRLVVIVDEAYEQLSDVETCLSQLDIFANFNRHYVLFNKFDDFKNKYPFLALSLDTTNIDNAVDFDTYQKELLKQNPDGVLYANSSFPFELEANKILMGTNFNKNNKKQINDLEIKKTVEVVLDQEKHNLVDVKDNDAFVYINREKLIDFDGMFVRLEEFINNDKVLFCAQDYRLISTFCIAFMMWTKKIPVNVASLKVFNIMGNTDADRIVYNQVMNFIPGAIKIVNV